MRFLSPVSLSLPALALASPVNSDYSQRAARSEGIHWAPCDIPNAVLPMQCGNLDVPLDYTNGTSPGGLQLDILRVPAALKPKKGSIFLNFGGPGASGIGDFALYAERMQAATGGHHDLINIVPRGTNSTIPFSCYADDSSRTLGTQALAGNAYEGAIGHVWAKSTLFATNCAAMQNQTGQFVGTAFVVRDMMSVLDALGEDGLLRYWGVSYGSLLGATAVAMFPDRVDKVILDGVVNPFEYYQNSEVELYSDVDATFKGFCAGCIAAPEACPLAKNLTADQLEETLYSFFDTLKTSPIPLPIPGSPGGGSLMDYSSIKAYVYQQLYVPQLWPNLATVLNAYQTGNLSALASDDSSSSSSPSPTTVPMDQESRQGIKCGDVRTQATSLAEMMPLFEARHAKSRLAGDSTDDTPATCAQWQLPAKEVYGGDFNVKPRNPVLLIGNTHDPVTPFVSARNVSETFEGSGLLQHDAYGHDSLSQASLCTAQAVRAYFTNGDLPAPGTICEVKTPFFSGSSGWDEVLEQLKASA